jgi:hypothetical protein
MYKKLHGVSTNSVRATPSKQKQFIFHMLMCHCVLKYYRIGITWYCVQSHMVQWNRYSRQKVDGKALTLYVLTACIFFSI